MRIKGGTLQLTLDVVADKNPDQFRVSLNGIFPDSVWYNGKSTLNGMQSRYVYSGFTPMDSLTIIIQSSIGTVSSEIIIPDSIRVVYPNTLQANAYATLDTTQDFQVKWLKQADWYLVDYISLGSFQPGKDTIQADTLLTISKSYLQASGGIFLSISAFNGERPYWDSRINLSGDGYGYSYAINSVSNFIIHLQQANTTTIP